MHIEEADGGLHDGGRYRIRCEECGFVGAWRDQEGDMANERFDRAVDNHALHHQRVLAGGGQTLPGKGEQPPPAPTEKGADENVTEHPFETL